MNYKNIIRVSVVLAAAEEQTAHPALRETRDSPAPLARKVRPAHKERMDREASKELPEWREMPGRTDIRGQREKEAHRLVMIVYYLQISFKKFKY